MTMIFYGGCLRVSCLALAMPYVMQDLRLIVTLSEESLNDFLLVCFAGLSVHLL